MAENLNILINDKIDKPLKISDNRMEEPNNFIKPIDRQTVHKICSGQVVLTLAVAVKELVENALDAGATVIEVKLREYGSEMVEVIDNGGGVLKENFQALTLKHYTSKIRDFSDLEYIETLGFRGEALSSLCALSNVTIVTRHSSADVATKITYDNNGKIIDQCTAPRSQGTTVSLTNLFNSLPVRRKEFIKNLKREFNKMCQLLYAYCIISTKVKFTCVNQLSKGSKSIILATQGLGSLKDNIINIFGAKQISSLIDISTVDPIKEVLEEYGIENDSANEKPFKFDCLISNVMHGSGRSVSDRQFFYINSRPCEPSKVIKLINDTYRQYNGNQYPFVYLNILTKSTNIDVNVTPDKRQIFMQKEKLLLAYLKTSLLEAFKDFPSTFEMQNLDVVKVEKKNFNQTTLKGIKRSVSENDGIKLLDVFRKKAKKNEVSDSEMSVKEVYVKNEPKISIDLKQENEVKSKLESLKEDVRLPIKSENNSLTNITNDIENKQDIIRIDEEIEIRDEIISLQSLTECELKKEKSKLKELITDVLTTPKFDEKLETSFKAEAKTLEVNLEAIRSRLKKHDELMMSGKENRKDIIQFRADISPTSNQEAERELQKRVTKDKFREMEVIGQFNMGFIITKLEDDLFIIDQHATDEKYNFEQLQANTVLESQILVNPKPLHLTAANENLLIDNEEIFKKNGFTFSIDHNAEPTKKIKLLSIPLSKNYVFGKDDIDELIFILQETAQTMCRPSRVRQMFASRACRKSVMIGNALTHSDMRRLVNHMGEIDQPWNCPHGRPTMRHLINLNLISKK